MSRSMIPFILYTDATELAALVKAMEDAVRERAFELGRNRTSNRDDIRDWLDAERALFRRPNIRISLDDKHYRVEVELPGIDTEDITLRFGGDRMIVEAKRREPDASPSPNASLLVDERGAASWWREQRLPTDAVTRNVEVTLADGVLRLSLARAEPMKSVTEQPAGPTVEANAARTSPPKASTRAAPAAKDTRAPKFAAKPAKKAPKPRSKSNDA